jgi:hypothetical protein
MNLKDALESGSYNHKQTLLEMDGQVIDVLPDLPRGYEYRLQKVTSGAMNSETALLIVKKEEW